MQGFFMLLANGVKFAFNRDVLKQVEHGQGGGWGTLSLKVLKQVEPAIPTHSLCSPWNHFHRQCHDTKPSAKAHQLIKESLKVGAHTTNWHSVHILAGSDKNWLAAPLLCKITENAVYQPFRLVSVHNVKSFFGRDFESAYYPKRSLMEKGSPTKI